MKVAVAFVAGGLGWTAAEYLLHRFVGHGPRRRPPASVWARLRPSGLAAAFNDEHLRHHADAGYFAPTRHKLVAGGLVAVTLALLGTIGAGPAIGVAFALGFGATYGAYEVLHRRIHTHAPRGRYGRWRRRHHLYHHFKTPRMNHGVTSALWDKVARTEVALAPGERLRVPPHLAPPWLLDTEGRVRPGLSADYEVPGRAARPAA